MDNEITLRMSKLKESLNIDFKIKQLAELKTRLQDESLWTNWEEGQKVSQEASTLQKEIEEFQMLELMLEEGDSNKFEAEFKIIELKTYLPDIHDRGNALVSIHAGQGGTEAMDWTAMLYRMYQRYCEKKDWKFIEVNSLQGEEAGLKTVSFEIDGPYAYGFLKREAGVHRLVRQSPFNADSLRQTSFALVEVTPLVEEHTQVEVKDEDLEWEFYRAGGPGGQNVNKVSTAVRLKHIPSKIIVECQEERFQGKNREKALQILRSKLYALELEKIEAEKRRQKGDFKTPGWGSQIRNYVLHPYKLVKDLRTNTESTNPEEVLNGDLDLFIDAEIRL